MYKKSFRKKILENIFFENGMKSSKSLEEILFSKYLLKFHLKKFQNYDIFHL